MLPKAFGHQKERLKMFKTITFVKDGFGYTYNGRNGTGTQKGIELHAHKAGNVVTLTPHSSRGQTNAAMIDIPRGHIGDLIAELDAIRQQWDAEDRQKKTA